MSGYYSVDELKELGLREFGKNVLISRKASICNPANLDDKDSSLLSREESESDD